MGWGVIAPTYTNSWRFDMLRITKDALNKIQSITIRDDHKVEIEWTVDEDGRPLLDSKTEVEVTTTTGMRQIGE